jgi:hypothetical protein
MMVEVWGVDDTKEYRTVQKLEETVDPGRPRAGVPRCSGLEGGIDKTAWEVELIDERELGDGKLAARKS